MSYVNEVMEAEYVDFIDQVASGKQSEVFMADLQMPELPASRFECIRLPLSGLREPLTRPSRLHRRLTDEWRFGHINGWICRDHYAPRGFCTLPLSTATAPRFLPIAHAVDAASRYQVAEVLEEKSGLEVIKFFQECWFNTLSVPSQITTDRGREFTAAVVQHTMDMRDVVLHHAPVGAPWQNGIAERAGGSLKAVLRATIHEAVAAGMDDMRTALASALEAVNNDVDGTGFSPSQMVLGRQPRVLGEAGPSDLRTRLAAHSMALETPSFSRLVAMREVAKLAMVRLHYSRALRAASVARARDQVGWDGFTVGDVVYFFREQKPTSKKMKLVQRRRLELKKWHGPGVLLAIEGKEMPNAAYVAYGGNVTKVAMNHLRHASSLERLVASDWDAIVEDVINAVEDQHPDDQQEGDGIGEESYEPTEPPEEPPEVQPELRGESPTPAVVYPFPYPAMMPALVQAAPCSSYSMDFLVEAQNLEVDFVVMATYILFNLNKLMMVVTLRPDKNYLLRVGSRKLQLSLDLMLFLKRRRLNMVAGLNKLKEL